MPRNQCEMDRIISLLSSLFLNVFILWIQLIQYISNISIENIGAVGFNGGFIKACHIIHHIHCVLLKLVLTELMNETVNDANCFL